MELFFSSSWLEHTVWLVFSLYSGLWIAQDIMLVDSGE